MKRALVTGATGKIGKAVCLALADAGYDICIHYHKSKLVAHGLAEEIRKKGRESIIVDADLVKVRKCDKLVDQVYNQFDHIDVLVHCSSVYVPAEFGKVTADDWEEIFATNCRAAFFLSQKIAMKMKKDGLRGSIVHFSDVAAERPYPDYIPYSMSKAALNAMVKGFAVKFAPEVRINAIAPYLVREADKLHEKDAKLIKRTPLKRHTEPREIANLVRMLCESGCTITGQVITVDGGRSLTW
jgi:pteridine reductase